MTEDEDYWNSASNLKAFDFDDIQEVSTGENVMRLFGPPSKKDAHPEDADQQSNNSDDTRSVRSDVTDEEISKTSTFGKPLVSRTTSYQSSSGRSGVVSPVIPSVPIPVNLSTSPALSASSKSSVRARTPVRGPETPLRPSAEPDSSQSNLRDEIRYLRKNLDANRKEQWAKIPASDMVWRIVQTKPYGLENYRGLAEKVELLDHALSLHESNAILIAVLHMKNSLSAELFCQELRKKPDAVDQYVAYLCGDGRYQECVDLLLFLGRADEAAVLQLKMALRSEDTGLRLKQLDLCIRNHPPPVVGKLSDLTHLKTFKSLMEIQRPIEDNDEKAARDPKNELFILFPRRNLLGISLLQTLYYCCMYHFEKQDTSFSSPHYLRKTFGINEKQFFWTAVNALSKTLKWSELQALLTDRTGWFGVPKPKAVIGFDKVADILVRNGSPPDVLAYYLRLIEDPETRLRYSLLCKCHSVAVDTLAALKEYDKLQEYGAKFDPSSPEFKYIQDLIHRVR